MLSPYRVLDLTGRGLLCAQILAGSGRRRDPGRAAGGESGAARRALLSRSPRPGALAPLLGIRAQQAQRRARSPRPTRAGDTLRRLAQTAHFFIESEAPGTLAASGLGYADLAALNPGLVYVSITPFGQDGPKAQWKGGDLVALAAGGPLFLYGDADRAPARICVPQAWNHAAAEAAVAALVAHHERQHSGRGQHVDVSAQQAVTLATQTDILSAALGDTPLSRSAGGLSVGPFTLRFVYPAKDGHISITHVFGSVIGHATGHLMEYSARAGLLRPSHPRQGLGRVRRAHRVWRGARPGVRARGKRPSPPGTGSKTKAELFAGRARAKAPHRPNRDHGRGCRERAAGDTRLLPERRPRGPRSAGSLSRALRAHEREPAPVPAPAPLPGRTHARGVGGDNRRRSRRSPRRSPASFPWPASRSSTSCGRWPDPARRASLRTTERPSSASSRPSGWTRFARSGPFQDGDPPSREVRAYAQYERGQAHADPRSDHTARPRR